MLYYFIALNKASSINFMFLTIFFTDVIWHSVIHPSSFRKSLPFETQTPLKIRLTILKERNYDIGDIYVIEISLLNIIIQRFIENFLS